MSTSAHRNYLRRQRQAARSWELTPDFINKHPDAARLYIIFGRTGQRLRGHTIDSALAAVAKVIGMGTSKREARANAKIKKQLAARAAHNEKLRAEERARQTEQHDVKKGQAVVNQGGAIRKTMLRKKEG